MPRKPIDYSKTYFYKIVCKDTSITDCYVGHTTDFTKRKHKHKHSCLVETNKSHNCNVYQYIRSFGGWDTWEMILIDTIACENSLDARKKEREFVEKFKATLNINIPSRSSKEHYNDNKIQMLEKCKEYRETNKEQVLLKQKEYRENNKEKCYEQKKQWKENNPERYKQYFKDYYLKNKEYKQEWSKQYRERNKDTISLKKKEYREKHREAILLKKKEYRERKKQEKLLQSLQD